MSMLGRFQGLPQCLGGLWPLKEGGGSNVEQRAVGVEDAGGDGHPRAPSGGRLSDGGDKGKGKGRGEG